MAIELIRVDSTNHLESLRNIKQNKIAPFAACIEK